MVLPNIHKGSYQVRVLKDVSVKELKKKKKKKRNRQTDRHADRQRDIHTYIHTNMHTHIHTHTYIHTYIHSYIHTTYIHTYIHTYIQYIHTCTLSVCLYYIDTYRHKDRQTDRQYMHVFSAGVERNNGH